MISQYPFVVDLYISLQILFPEYTAEINEVSIQTGMENVTSIARMHYYTNYFLPKLKDVQSEDIENYLNIAIQLEESEFLEEWKKLYTISRKKLSDVKRKKDESLFNTKRIKDENCAFGEDVKILSKRKAIQYYEKRKRNDSIDKFSDEFKKRFKAATYGKKEIEKYIVNKYEYEINDYSFRNRFDQEKQKGQYILYRNDSDGIIISDNYLYIYQEKYPLQNIKEIYMMHESSIDRYLLIQSSDGDVYKKFYKEPFNVFDYLIVALGTTKNKNFSIGKFENFRICQKCHLREIEFIEKKRGYREPFCKHCGKKAYDHLMFLKSEEKENSQKEILVSSVNNYNKLFKENRNREKDNVDFEINLLEKITNENRIISDIKLSSKEKEEFRKKIQLMMLHDENNKEYIINKPMNDLSRKDIRLFLEKNGGKNEYVLCCNDAVILTDSNIYFGNSCIPISAINEILYLKLMDKPENEYDYDRIMVNLKGGRQFIRRLIADEFTGNIVNMVNVALDSFREKDYKTQMNKFFRLCEKCFSTSISEPSFLVNAKCNNCNNSIQTQISYHGNAEEKIEKLRKTVINYEEKIKRYYEKEQEKERLKILAAKKQEEFEKKVRDNCALNKKKADKYIQSYRSKEEILFASEFVKRMNAIMPRKEKNEVMIDFSVNKYDYEITDRDILKYLKNEKEKGLFVIWFNRNLLITDYNIYICGNKYPLRDIKELLHYRRTWGEGTKIIVELQNKSQEVSCEEIHGTDLLVDNIDIVLESMRKNLYEFKYQKFLFLCDKCGSSDVIDRNIFGKTPKYKCRNCGNTQFYSFWEHPLFTRVEGYKKRLEIYLEENEERWNRAQKEVKEAEVSDANDLKQKIRYENKIQKKIYCMWCGKTISANSKFCSFCGKENKYHI